MVGHLAKGDGEFAVPVRVPVMRDGKLRYVLTAAVKPDGVLEIVRRQRVPPEWVVSVFEIRSDRLPAGKSPVKVASGQNLLGLAAD